MEENIIRKIVNMIIEFDIDDSFKERLIKEITRIIKDETEAREKALSQLSILNDAFKRINK